MSSLELFDLPEPKTGAAISSVKSTRRVAARLAALALLILCIDCSPCLARQFFNEQQLDQSIFQTDQNADGARRRLDSQLSVQLEEIDRVCKLTEAQKEKLQLAARGDIKRFFDRYETIKRHFKPLDQTQPEFQEEYQKLWQDIRPLQQVLQSGLFRQDSLLHKSLQDSLTGQQHTSYVAVERERRLLQHRAIVALTVSSLEEMVPLRTTCNGKSCWSYWRRKRNLRKCPANTITTISCGNSVVFPLTRPSRCSTTSSESRWVDSSIRSDRWSRR